MTDKQQNFAEHIQTVAKDARLVIAECLAEISGAAVVQDYARVNSTMIELRRLENLDTSGVVMVPSSIEQAKAQLLVAHRWLKDNAPGELEGGSHGEG